MARSATVARKTNETDIEVTLDLASAVAPDVSTGLPFFDHMLVAMAHHGHFSLSVRAAGDLAVDPHHLVEDTGIVIGSALNRIFAEGGPVARFAHFVIPMDEALSEATVDVCGRSTLCYDPHFPQEYSGDFPMWLFREFFLGLAGSAKISLHLECRYGDNAHHMIEALFKALGKALGTAYAPGSAAMSTKGTI
jgi:imidazoleglycerol-phosphate dehydratase